MSDMRGRCENVEYCSVAVSQRIITLPGTVPFNCPKCGDPLIELQAAARAKRNTVVLAVQALVIVAAGGAVAYKLLGGISAQHGTETAAATPPAAAEPAAFAVAEAPGKAVNTPAIVAAPAPAAAAPAPAPAAAAAVTAPPTALLRLAGSEVIGSRLARRLSSGYLALIGDSDITTAPGPGAGAVSVVGNQAGQLESIAIAPGGSAGGFQALLRGSADIAMSTRQPNAAEIERLAAVVDLTNAANEHVIAVDGVAAIVSPANRIAALTLDQLRAAFTGRITDWSQLGGAPGPIHLVVQDGAAGRADEAADMILQGAAPAPQLRREPTDAAVAAAVASDRSALGAVTLGHEATARVVPIAAAAGGTPVEASELTISTEDYPLTRRLYLYTATQAGASAARRFLDYASSAGGQAVVEAAGFVPLTVKLAPVALPPTASARYRQIVSGATRLSVDFRFQPGSVALDSRSGPDMARLTAFLHAKHADGSRLMLAGFADSSGTPSANMLVSQRRADAVVAALGKAGITPGRVAVFGAELPVADNATAEGRERNRRVEVYLAGQ